MINDVAPLPGYPEPYGLLAAVLNDGTAEWRAELPADIDPDGMIWRVRPGGQSMGAVMLHIVGVEVFWFERFVLGREYDIEEVNLLMLREIDVDSGVWPDPPHEPLSWYFELHDRIRARTLQGMRTWPNADSLKEHDGRPRTPRWVLGHVIQHEAYHGGQIVMLHDLWQNRDSR